MQACIFRSLVTEDGKFSIGLLRLKNFTIETLQVFHILLPSPIYNLNVTILIQSKYPAEQTCWYLAKDCMTYRASEVPPGERQLTPVGRARNRTAWLRRICRSPITSNPALCARKTVISKSGIDTCPLGSANNNFPFGFIVVNISANKHSLSGNSWTNAKASAKSILPARSLTPSE